MIRNKELPENIQYEIALKAQEELKDSLSTSTTLVIDSKAMSSTDISMFLVNSYNKRNPNKKIIIKIQTSSLFFILLFISLCFLSNTQYFRPLSFKLLIECFKFCDKI